MGSTQPQSLWIDVQLSECLVFVRPHRLLEVNSQARHFRGQIPSNETPETVKDLKEYIRKEFQISSPIELLRSDGNFFNNTMSVDQLFPHCLLVVRPKMNLTSSPNTSSSVSLWNCSLSTVSSTFNDSTNNADSADSILQNNRHTHSECDTDTFPLDDKETDFNSEMLQFQKRIMMKEKETRKEFILRLETWLRSVKCVELNSSEIEDTIIAVSSRRVNVSFKLPEFAAIELPSLSATRFNLGQHGNASETPKVNMPISILKHTPRAPEEGRILKSRICKLKRAPLQEPLLNVGLETTTVEMNATEIEYCCSYPACNFKERYQHRFKNHLAKAHNATPFKCSTCNKGFKHCSTLSHHIKTHQVDKKHSCSFPNCDYYTYRSDYLKKHMKIHK